MNSHLVGKYFPHAISKRSFNKIDQRVVPTSVQIDLISFYHLPGIYNNNLKVFVFKFFNTIGSNDSRIWFRVAERTAETLKL